MRRESVGVFIEQLVTAGADTSRAESLSDWITERKLNFQCRPAELPEYRNLI